MMRPAMEVADIVRTQGRQFLERYSSSLSYQHLKAFSRHRALPHSCRRAKSQVGLQVSTCKGA
jgi:hypothetical protein